MEVVPFLGLKPGSQDVHRGGQAPHYRRPEAVPLARVDYDHVQWLAELPQDGDLCPLLGSGDYWSALYGPDLARANADPSGKFL